MEKKLLLYSTAILALLFALAIFFLPQAHRRIALDTTGFPTIGNQNAPVHVIVLEEFACVQCKRLHNEEIPLLRKEYVETGKVKLTTIPLAFLEESKLPFLSLHCASSQGASHFHRFLERFFSLPNDKFLQQSERELLTSYATDYPDFSQSTAIACVRETALAPLLQRTEYIVAPIFRGGKIELPTILVNGRRIQKNDWHNIKKSIEEELLLSQRYVENRKAL